MQPGETIPHIRGVFMRDSLPPFVKTAECGVYNLDLDSKSGTGSHWVCYYTKPGVNKRTAIYFDSFGLDPPEEVHRRNHVLKVGGGPEAGCWEWFNFNFCHDMCGHICLCNA